MPSPGRSGAIEVAVAHLDHVVDEVGPAGLVLGHVLLQLPVRHAHAELDVRRDRHRPGRHGVRKHTGVERLRERADLLDVRDPAGDPDVGADERDTRAARGTRRTPRSSCSARRRRRGRATLAANARSAATLSGGIGSSTKSGRNRASSPQSSTASPAVMLRWSSTPRSICQPTVSRIAAKRATRSSMPGGLAHQVVVVLEEQDLQRACSPRRSTARRAASTTCSVVAGLDDPHRANRAPGASAEQLPDRNARSACP